MPSHPDEQQKEVLAGRRPYVSSTVLDLEAATRVAAEADISDPDGASEARRARCSPDRLLMVAAHAWDLRGAQALGMRTAYVERPIGDPPTAMDSFDLDAKSLDDLATSLDAT